MTRCIQIVLQMVAYFFTPQLEIQITHTGLKDRMLQLTLYPQITPNLKLLESKGYRPKQQAMKNYRKKACLGHKGCKGQLPSICPLLLLNLFSVHGVFFCLFNHQLIESLCENTVFLVVWGFQLLEGICMNACTATTVCAGNGCSYCGSSELF